MTETTDATDPEPLPRDRYAPAILGSVSFDCVNGVNVYLESARVYRRHDAIRVEWGVGPLWSIDGVRPEFPDHNPFRRLTGRKGILAIFDDKGGLLAEDVCRLAKAVVRMKCRYAWWNRYHPRRKAPS